MQLVPRGATQLACRLHALGNGECVLLLGAARNSDEVRNQFEKRRCAPTTARRLARDPSLADSSGDQWPGKMAPSRPEVAFPGSEPQAEPGAPAEVCSAEVGGAPACP